MKLVFLPSAHSDLVWMRMYYTQVFPDGAKRAAKQYKRILGVLQENPLVGHWVEGTANVREFPVPGIPFSLLYRIADGRIEVLRIWDQRGDRSGIAGSEQ